MKEFNVASDSIDWDEVRDRYTMQILEDSTSRETKYKKNEHERRKLSSLHSESLNQITSSNYKVKKKKAKGKTAKSPKYEGYISGKGKSQTNVKKSKKQKCIVKESNDEGDIQKGKVNRAKYQYINHGRSRDLKGSKVKTGKIKKKKRQDTKSKSRMRSKMISSPSSPRQMSSFSPSRTNDMNGDIVKSSAYYTKKSKGSKTDSKKEKTSKRSKKNSKSPLFDSFITIDARVPYCDEILFPTISPSPTSLLSYPTRTSASPTSPTSPTTSITSITSTTSTTSTTSSTSSTSITRSPSSLTENPTPSGGGNPIRANPTLVPTIDASTPTPTSSDTISISPTISLAPTKEQGIYRYSEGTCPEVGSLGMSFLSFVIL